MVAQRRQCDAGRRRNERARTDERVCERYISAKDAIVLKGWNVAA